MVFTRTEQQVSTARFDLDILIDKLLRGNNEVNIKRSGTLLELSTRNQQGDITVLFDPRIGKIISEKIA